MPGDENSDMSVVAEVAREQGIERYGLLHDLKKQVMLAALAGMYHQWDKELRDFVERELQHGVKPKEVRKIAWSENISDVFDVLKDFGWDPRKLAVFPLIDACRLVVNVYKHGKGRSLEDLAEKHPEFLNQPLRGLVRADASWLDHEWLEVSEAQFRRIADAIEKFWVQFPERLFLTI